MTLEAQVEVFQTNEPPQTFIVERSAGVADLILLGMRQEAIESFGETLASMEEALSRLPTTLLVWSNGDADLFA